MFKSARWRSEKNKVKAEFKLQFYVTQVWLRLLILFVLSLLFWTFYLILEVLFWFWIAYSGFGLCLSNGMNLEHYFS